MYRLASEADEVLLRMSESDRAELKQTAAAAEAGGRGRDAATDKAEITRGQGRGCTST